MKFRIIECSNGKYRIEQKFWFGWRYIVERVVLPVSNVFDPEFITAPMEFDSADLAEAYIRNRTKKDKIVKEIEV